MTKPLKDRLRDDGIDEGPDEMSRDFGRLCEHYGIIGAVMVTFQDDDSVHVRSSGTTKEMSNAMEELADRILEAIDDGTFDPAPPRVQ